MQIKVETYAELEQYVRAFDEDQAGDFILMFIVGDPGISKSTIVRKVMGDRDEGKTLWVNGAVVSPFRLYQDLYANIGRPVVIDDCDQLWNDRGCIALLKSLCQTEPVRTIEWSTTATQLDSKGIPYAFKTHSRAIIINNKWKTISQHVGSLEDRGIMISFEPTVREVLDYGKTWFKDKEVIDLVEANFEYIPKLSLRKLYNARMLRQKGIENWRDRLLESLGVNDLRVVERLMDEEVASEAEREAKFAQITGKSRAHYYDCKRHLDGVRANTGRTSSKRSDASKPRRGRPRLSSMAL